MHEWTKIIALPSADRRLAALCTRALEDDLFQPGWIMPNGDYIISFTADSTAYIGVIQAQEGEGIEGALAILPSIALIQTK